MDLLDKLNQETKQEEKKELKVEKNKELECLIKAWNIAAKRFYDESFFYHKCITLLKLQSLFLKKKINVN